MVMPALQSASRGEDVRSRLLQAAGQVFAEIGYEAATVRQITERAQVNIAAVNYYYRDKLHLYSAVLEMVTGRALESIQKCCQQGSAEQRLTSFIRGILQTESSERYPWARLLMAREIVEFHDAQAEVIVRAVRPMHDIAESIVNELMGKQANPALVRFSTGLLVSICVNHLTQQRLDLKLYTEISIHEIDMETTIAELSRFVMAGIRALAQP